MEQVLAFSAPDGLYTLKHHILLDSPQNLHQNIGTFLSISLPKYKSLTVTDVKPSHKFVQVTSSEEKFSFLKVKKSSKIVKENQLVSKIIVNDQIAKIITANQSYLFFNVGRALGFVDVLYSLRAPLSVAHFKEAFITCHDINVLADGMNVVIGFNTGDLLYYSPISGKYSHFNRNIHKFGVKCVRWIPGSETMFMAGFEDGSILEFDIEAEDQGINIPATEEEFLVSNAPQNTKINPKSYWKISSKEITSISFSPDSIHFACCSMDGKLRVADYYKQKLLDVYQSYFGGLLCCSWSPDGRFIIGGGQDDLISIWQFRYRLVAWFQGHMSWVTQVAFDNNKCTDGAYRIVSVGEDTRICFWDFSMSGLHRPKGGTGTIGRVRSKMGIESKGPVIHEAPVKSQIPIIEALLCKKIHSYPISGLAISEDAIFTADKLGNVLVWNKP